MKNVKTPGAVWSPIGAQQICDRCKSKTTLVEVATLLFLDASANLAASTIFKQSDHD